MKKNLRRVILLFQLLAGLSDASTGLLLIFAPEWTLRLMGVTQIPTPHVSISYTGVFVFSVGFSYLWAFAFWARNPAHLGEWKAQWILTAFIRSIVAIFVLWNVSSAQLEVSWLSVAFTDATFALIQWTCLSNGWLAYAE